MLNKQYENSFYSGDYKSNQNPKPCVVIIINIRMAVIIRKDTFASNGRVRIIFSIRRTFSKATISTIRFRDTTAPT